jgi:[acyl-carrier-protein] S-malonyltransferase
MLVQKSRVIVFPGQGSQRIGMLKDFADSFASVKATFNAMSEICHEDLWRIAQEGPQETLDDTRITQPIMFAADLALYQVLQEWDSTPSFVAGHSLGEYAALVASGILSFEDAGKLVCHRARLMASAYPKGEGAVGVIIQASFEQVQDWCMACSKANSQSGHQAWVANINSPTQLVIAGHKAAVEAVLNLAKLNHSKFAKLLPVSVPVHCPLMQVAADQLKCYFDDVTFHPPTIPMIFNVDACFHQDPKSIKQALYEQLFKPVLWLKSMEVMMSQNPSSIIESGPGGVLAGLFNRTFKEFSGSIIQLNTVCDLQQVKS